jgi:hypothetical protein
MDDFLLFCQTWDLLQWNRETFLERIFEPDDNVALYMLASVRHFQRLLQSSSLFVEQQDSTFFSQMTRLGNVAGLLRSVRDALKSQARREEKLYQLFASVYIFPREISTMIMQSLLPATICLNQLVKDIYEYCLWRCVHIRQTLLDDSFHYEIGIGDNYYVSVQSRTDFWNASVLLIQPQL